MSLTRVISSVLLSLCCVMSACGGDDGGGQANPVVLEYVGTIAGVDPTAVASASGFFVAVAIDDSRAVQGYICDGLGT